MSQITPPSPPGRSAISLLGHFFGDPFHKRTTCQQKNNHVTSTRCSAACISPEEQMKEKTPQD